MLSLLPPLFPPEDGFSFSFNISPVPCLKINEEQLSLFFFFFFPPPLPRGELGDPFVRRLAFQYSRRANARRSVQDLLFFFFRPRESSRRSNFPSFPSRVFSLFFYQLAHEDCHGGDLLLSLRAQPGKRFFPFFFLTLVPGHLHGVGFSPSPIPRAKPTIDASFPPGPFNGADTASTGNAFPPPLSPLPPPAPHRWIPPPGSKGVIAAFQGKDRRAFFSIPPIYTGQSLDEGLFIPSGFFFFLPLLFGSGHDGAPPFFFLLPTSKNQAPQNVNQRHQHARSRNEEEIFPPLL